MRHGLAWAHAILPLLVKLLALFPLQKIPHDRVKFDSSSCAQTPRLLLARAPPGLPAQLVQQVALGGHEQKAMQWDPMRRIEPVRLGTVLENGVGDGLEAQMLIRPSKLA